MDGWEALRQLREVKPEAPIIVLSGSVDPSADNVGQAETR